MMMQLCLRVVKCHCILSFDHLNDCFLFVVQQCRAFVPFRLRLHRPFFTHLFSTEINVNAWFRPPRLDYALNKTIIYALNDVDFAAGWSIFHVVWSIVDLFLSIVESLGTDCVASLLSSVYVLSKVMTELNITSEATVSLLVVKDVVTRNDG